MAAVSSSTAPQPAPGHRAVLVVALPMAQYGETGQFDPELGSPGEVALTHLGRLLQREVSLGSYLDPDERAARIYVGSFDHG